jgi:hypothetical protein
MQTLRLSLLAGLVAAPVVAAPIDSVTFSGNGVITISNYALVPPVGSPVRVSGFVNFGDDPLPQGFTGTVSLNNLEGGRSFGYSIDGAGISEFASLPFPPPYFGGRVTLERGRLTSVSLFADNDGDLSDLLPTTWRGVTGFYAQDGIIREWGGTWTLSAVPEPMNWAMMIAGFALVGAALRHQRRAAATI